MEQRVTTARNDNKFFDEKDQSIITTLSGEQKAK